MTSRDAQPAAGVMTQIVLEWLFVAGGTSAITLNVNEIGRAHV